MNQGRGQVVLQVEAIQGSVHDEDQLVVGLGKPANVLPSDLGIGDLVNQVVGDVVSGLAPACGEGDDLGQQVDGLVGDSDQALLVGHGVQGLEGSDVEHGIAVALNVVLQGLAAQPVVQSEVGADVHGDAIGGGVGAVLSLDQVSHQVTGGSQVVLGHVDLTLLQVSLSIVDLDGAGVHAVSAVVLSLGVQQTLGGLNEVVGGDGGAILPHQVLTQVQDVSSGSVALDEAELADVVSSHIDGIAHGHAIDHGVAVLGLVVVEDIETRGDVVQDLRISSGLVGVVVPVGGELSQCVVVGVGTCNSGGGGLNGSSGLGGVAAASDEAQNHDNRQNQGKQFLHFLFLLENFYRRKNRVYNNCSAVFA